MVHRLPGLITERSAAVAALCERTYPTRLDLFGSAVREDFDAPSSDLDFSSRSKTCRQRAVPKPF